MELIVSSLTEAKIKQAILMGIELAPQATGKSSYYHEGDKQELSVDAAIVTMGTVGLDIPLLIAATLGSGYFAQRALLVELSSAKRIRTTAVVSPVDWADEKFGKVVIEKCLERLDTTAGVPYVLRLFMELKKARVNNKRTRSLILNYIWSRHNLEFFAVKYRQKLRAILRHVYGLTTLRSLLLAVEKTIDNVASEEDFAVMQKYIGKYCGLNDSIRAAYILLFIFSNPNWKKIEDQKFPVLAQYKKALVDINGCDLIPLEVLMGLVANNTHPQYFEKWGTPENRKATRAALKGSNKSRTETTKVREISQDKSLGVSTTIDYDKVERPDVLLKSSYETGVTNSETDNRLEKLAEKYRIAGFPYQSIGIVLDVSPSMEGHFQETKHLPRARAQFAGMVLEKSARTTKVRKTSPYFTNLAMPFIEVLSSTPDIEAVFIISDMYENSPDGLLEKAVEMLRRYNACPPIFAINPLDSAEFQGGLRKLEGIVSLPAEHTMLSSQFSLALAKADALSWIKSVIYSLEGNTNANH